MIVAAGLLATTCTLHSCKKEGVKPTTTTSKSGNSNARLLTTAEATDLVTEVNNFLPYAEAVAVNPSAQAPNTLPSTLADADVVRYVENGLNFTYALQEDKLKNHLQDEFSITIPKSNGNANINNVANSFVAAYNHIKTVYNNIACANDEKVLRVVDVEVSNTSNSSMTIKLISVFEWKYDPTVPSPSASAISISSGEWADFASMGGNNITSLDPTGTVGAPDILNGVLRANYGGYLFLGGVVPKVKFSRYIVTSITNEYFGVWPHSSGADLPATAPQNPWIVGIWGTFLSGMPSTIKDRNSLVFYSADPATPVITERFDRKLPSNLLNYMITWNDWVLKNKETSLGKNLWDLKFDEYTPPSTPVTQKCYVMETKYANVYDMWLTPVIKYTPPPHGGLATF